MEKKIGYIIIVCLLLGRLSGLAQQGFYVPHAGKIFFTGDSATIFSNVINHGNLGVGDGAFVNFRGATWENDPVALITDESSGGDGVTGIGGWIKFYSDSYRQQIIGGYNAATKSGPAFARIQFQNTFGVELNGGNTKIRKEILLTAGHVFLKDNILVVGDNNPGKIKGYNESRFFVSGNQPGTGLLIRENITSDDQRVDFPIGSNEFAYTPAAVRNYSGQGDDYYVNVFDSAHADLFSGSNLLPKGVNKTWEIGKRNTSLPDQTEVFLQHLIADEGSFFNQNRTNTYVSSYSSLGWDTGLPQNLPAPGYITTGAILPNSGVNSRIFQNVMQGPAYFTKLTGTSNNGPQTQLTFSAYRIDQSKVHVYWITKPEVNVNYFIVQRRLANESVFTNIDTVASQVLSGISFNQLYYPVVDPNGYMGTSYYRLVRVDYGNTIAYSNIVEVYNQIKTFGNLLWPNPTPNKFYLGLSGAEPVKTIVIVNVLGQKVQTEAVNGRNLVEMGGLFPGTYFVTLLNNEGKLIETKKVVITGF